jgi:hypothetical protein
MNEWLIPLLTLAAAAGGVKVSLNGTKERVQRIETKLDTLIETSATTRERVATLEGVLEAER